MSTDPNDLDPDGDPEMLQSADRVPTQPDQAEGADDPGETEG
ncbi:MULTISPECIES: hypothetical protein [Mycolicibacterium]|nr:hypothetical protein [Mycolicibacterium pallens]